MIFVEVLFELLPLLFRQGFLLLCFYKKWLLNVYFDDFESTQINFK